MSMITDPCSSYETNISYSCVFLGVFINVHFPFPLKASLVQGLGVWMLEVDSLIQILVLPPHCGILGKVQFPNL